jgi:hypothetical protein
VRLTLVVLLALTSVAAATPQWQRSEEREPCAASDPLRRPFFGDIHVHTSYSTDAYIFGNRVDPRGAYRFMRGQGTVMLGDENEQPTRESHPIDRPLDFGAVTDHAEFFGETDLCLTPGSLVYDQSLCTQLRANDAGTDTQFLVTINWLFPLGIDDPPTQHAFCALPGVDCDAAAVSVWQEEQAAAEEAYDRTAACTFTSFIGYEHTPSPIGRHRHRNVIFRNATVPHIALSHLDTPGGVPQGLWTALEDQCIDAGTGCDAIVIPHNSNLSGGLQFPDPIDAADALRRQLREPLVEIHQIKGNSECRFDRFEGRGVDGADELCTFEQRPLPHEGPDAVPTSIDAWPRRNLVRSVLKDGLSFEQQLGANPFEFGFTGGTDNHNGLGGEVAESEWDGVQGGNDATPERRIETNSRENPGGVTGVWAEENSRDAIFAALKRRETFATSGPRPVLRVFAGALDGVACGDAEFVAKAYAGGVPMGGELGPAKEAPRLAIWAVKDPGTAEHPGTDLQRLQVVKGWLDADGIEHERVVDVAGDASKGGVDPATCAPQGAGFAELCTVWTDPDFDPAERAFYYVRLLETPVCRWTTTLCRSAGVDPLSPDCATQAAAAGEDFAACCRDTTNDAFAEPLVQERAWSSPIWYRPDTIARAAGQVKFGAKAGRDVLRLNLRIAKTGLDLAADPLHVRIADDDTILDLALSSGTMRRTGRGRWRLNHKRGKAERLAIVSLIERKGESVLRIRTLARDLSAADRDDHIVSVDLGWGVWRATHSRRWLAGRGSIALEATQ